MAAKEMISLRVWRSDLEAWKLAAKEAGVTRSAWINQTLNKATQRTSMSGGSVSAATDEGGSSDSQSVTQTGGSVSIAEVEERFKSYLSGPDSGEPPTS